MKFQCKTINLKEAIFKVERVVSKQTTLPILSNILISAEKSQVLVSATNLEIAIESFLGAKIIKEGKITVPAKILGGFLSTIQDELVEIELEGSDLKVVSGDNKIVIKGMEASDFPIIPQSPKESFFRIKNEDFNLAASSVLISVAHNDTRAELNGVFWRFGDNFLTMASTDSFRLSEVRVPIVKNSVSEDFSIFKEKNESVIIPAQTLSEFSSEKNEGEIEVMIKQNQLFINSNQSRVISRTINGNYPEYKQVLPEKYELEIKINKEEFLKSIKIATLISGGQNGEICLKSSKKGDKLVVKSESIDAGKNISKIEAKIKGGDFEVFFNGRYIIEGLASKFFNNNKDLVIKLNKEKSPVLFCLGEKEDNFSYVIMPIIKD